MYCAVVRWNLRRILILFLFLALVASLVPYLYLKISGRFGQYFQVAPAHPGILDTDIRSSYARPALLFDIDILNNDYITINTHLKAFNFKGIGISGDFFIKGRFGGGEQDAIFEGRLYSRSPQANGYALRNLNGLFSIRGDVLHIKQLSLGGVYTVTGTLSLKEPYPAGLKLSIKRADIRDITFLLKNRHRLPPILGMMNGSFYITGPLKNLYSKGTIESKNGRVGKVRYDIAMLELEGFGPIINIIDSKVRWGKSLLAVNGFIDLRRLGNNNVLETLELRSDLKTVAWRDWEIEGKGDDKLTMKKDLSENMTIGFKAVARKDLNPYRTEPAREDDEMSLDYRLGHQSIQMKLKEDEEFFGIQHSVKF